MPALASLATLQITTATEQVFQTLYAAIISLELAPGTKVSEAEIAKELGVSRQPVRDAFYRLSELGFLLIRPQRATTITYISQQALRDARFIRTALETECLRAAIENVKSADIAVLDALLDRQASAIKSGDKLGFHELDDQFHRTICEIAGHPNAWNMIRDQKVHLDRVRYLSLSFGAQSALDDHIAIMKCIRAKDTQGADAQIRMHLSRILQILGQVSLEHAEYFESEAE